MKRKQIVIALAAALGLSSCATSPEKLSSKAKERLEAEVRSVSGTQPSAKGLVKINSMLDLPIKMYEEGEVPEDTGSVSLKASGPLAAILEEVARQNGYSVQWMDGVDRNAKASASFSGLSVKAAVKRLALSAGYVAVVDTAKRNIIVAREAVYTFKLPMHTLKQLESAYSVGGNPASGAGQGGSQGESASSPVKASFTITGKTGMGGQNLITILQNLAGDNASLQVMQDSGYITVRANGQALERVRDFLSKLAADLERRIEIEASVIEVALGDQFAYGVDWTRILSRLFSSSAPVTITGSGGAAAITNPSIKVTYTTARLNEILAALNEVTDAKIVSSARITTTNRIPATIFDGQQVPYLGSISSTIQQTSTTVAAEASYASDGISLSIVPDIISDTEAQLSLIPVISGVQEFAEFDVGGGARIVAPRMSLKDSFITTMIRSGQTIVIGGIGFKSGLVSKTNLPLARIPMGEKEESRARETAIVLQAKIIPAKRRDILFSEHI